MPALAPPSPPAPARRTPVLGALALAALTFAVFHRAARNDFLTYDDPAYVTENAPVTAGLTAEGVRWALTSFHASNWHPLTWLSHMLDCELFGRAAAGHHLTSVAMHALAAALLFLALSVLTGEARPSFFAAGLFALHPLRVESVAWVAERKDVLSGLLAMATILAYALHARRPGGRRYGLVLVLFALGLLAKPMLVTLPAALLLLDLWPLGRWRGPGAGRRLILEKAPLFALAAASGVLTVLAQRAGGAVSALELLPLGARVENALASYVAYLGATVFPRGLAAFYPHPAIVAPGSFRALTLPALGAGLLLLAGTALALRARRRRPYALVGWLWYLGTLLPVIGLLQVGTQARADRYTYLPAVGIALLVAWGGRDLARARPRTRPLLGLLGGLALAGCAALSWRQIGVWRDTETLWGHAAAVTERNYVAEGNLGAALLLADEEAAVEHLRRAIEFHPRFPPPRQNLAQLRVRRGLAYEERGEAQRALAEYLEAALLAPDNHRAREYAGSLLVAQGDAAESTPLRMLAAACAAAGDFAAAVEWQGRAIARAPAGARPPLEAELARYRGGDARRE
ncbi:MAG: hypothetical protein AB1726_05830 [Planctomycetota bacterium]